MKNPTSDAILSQRSIASPDSSSNLPPRATPLSNLSASSPDSSAPRRTNKVSAKVKTPAKSAKSEADGTPESAGDDAKKRVRLKPETREQLLERLRNPPLSLHETSILLRVSRATVRRYADAGRLPCLRTPGGQRRFALRDIENFYRQLKGKR